MLKGYKRLISESIDTKNSEKQIIQKVKECSNQNFTKVVNNEIKIIKLYCEVLELFNIIISDMKNENTQSQSLYDYLKNKIINYFDPNNYDSYKIKAIYKSVENKIMYAAQYYSIHILLITDHSNYIDNLTDEKLFKNIDSEEDPYQNFINEFIITCDTFINKIKNKK